MKEFLSTTNSKRGLVFFWKTFLLYWAIICLERFEMVSSLKGQKFMVGFFKHRKIRKTYFVAHWKDYF